MRKLGQFIIFLMFIFPVTLLLGQIDFFVLFLEQDKDKQELLDTSIISLTHRQVDSGWLEFSLTQSSDAIRLLSNAAIPKEYTDDPDTIWHYAIEYQFLDDNDKIIAQEIYHHRSKITWLKNEQGQLLSQTFFLNKDLVPTSATEILLRTAVYPSLSKVRVRTYSQSPDIKFVFFRLYEREVLPDKKIDYLWQRMTQEERERASRFSIFGIDFLRDIERYQMLKYRWRPVGPGGIGKKNYATEKLYINKDEMTVPIEDKILTANIDADKDFYHVLPVPERGGLLSLEFKPLGDIASRQLNHVQISWYGKGRLKRKKMSFNLQDDKNWEQNVEGGLIEIRPLQPVTIRSWLTNDNQREEITPDAAVLPSFQLQVNQSLSYRVEHIKTQQTPVKVSIRRLLPDNDLADEQAVIKFHYYRQGEKRFSGEIRPEFIRTYYDRVLNVHTEGMLTEAYNYYLNIPPEIDRIEFQSSNSVYINLFNRPPSFSKRVRVPEDYYHLREIRHVRPIWFGIQPENQQQLLRNNQRVLIIIQPRPPLDEEVLSLQQYEWEDYFPNDDWQARYLLNERSNDLPVIDNSLSVLYSPIPVASTVVLDFTHGEGISTVEPSLIFLRNDIKPTKIKVYIDGKLHVDSFISGSNGQLKMPTINTGQHEVKIISRSDIQWFINHARGQPEYKVKRLSNRIDKKALTFDFYKSRDNMVLSGLFQSSYKEQQRTQLQVTVSPDKRKMNEHGFSLLNRQFDIRPDNSKAIRVLNTNKQFVGKGQRFFIPLGEDLPSGSYQISIELLDGAPGYISLYTFDFGSVEKYQFFKTTIIDEN